MNDPMIPTHLISLAADPVQEDAVLTLMLRCPCGSMHFRLEEAVRTPEEQKQVDAYEAADKLVRKGCIVRFRRDAQGNAVLMRRRFPFGRWEPLKPLLPEPPAFIDVRALRAACCQCGRMHLVHDNRLYGFDALSGEFTGAPMEWRPRWQEIPMPEDARVCLEIYTDVGPEEMQEFIPDFREEEACNSFGGLAAWSVVNQKRDCLLFESL